MEISRFIYAIGASVIVSLISLIGILTFVIKNKTLSEILILLIGFSAGSLIGSAFIHILPESLRHKEASSVFFYVIVGFVLFFMLEKYFSWRHCHEGVCDVHAFSYLNLVGDGIHNLIDGIIIGASFFIGTNFGIVSTLAIVLHEIPQEISDFGVLVYGGFSRLKALFCNFISASVSIIGAVLGYYFADEVEGLMYVILPVAAGGFIYIASCDLIPELHKQTKIERANLSMLAFILGIVLMFLLKIAPAY